MTPIDYEKEYDNRARVPEHLQIFARWEREAADYREAARQRGAEFAIAYGPSPRQKYDLFPANPRPLGDADAAPLAMFIHGGWWRSLDPAMFSQAARGLNERGITVAAPGYDLCPNVSIAAIIEQMRNVTLALWRKHRKRIMVCGHSAGGHLAGCLLAQDWKKFGSDAPADLVPAAYSISGVFDLAPLLHASQNLDLRLDTEEARRVSPVHWKIPPRRTLDSVVGADESNEFLRQSQAIVDAWGKQGAQVRYEALPGLNHFTVVDPLNDPASPMVARVAALAQRVSAMPR